MSSPYKYILFTHYFGNKMAWDHADVMRFRNLFGARNADTVNPYYTDTRYNEKIRYNDKLNITVNEKLCKNIALKIQATYVLDIC